MRILLVEDEIRLADALEQILKRQGYLVDVTGDGAAGQDMAETGIYGVIILDRMLLMSCVLPLPLFGQI